MNETTKYLLSLRGVTKAVKKVSDDFCPNCGEKMKLYKKCCGTVSGYKGCSVCKLLVHNGHTILLKDVK